jgi:hypothetical protein
VGVEAVFEGAAPGYRLEESAGAEAATSTEAAGVEVEKAAGWSACWRREFSGLPVYVGVEESYVKRTAPMDKRQFRRYLETCKKLGFRFDRGSSRWRSYSHLQRHKPVPTLTQPQQDTPHGQAGGGGSRIFVPPQSA